MIILQLLSALLGYMSAALQFGAGDRMDEDLTSVKVNYTLVVRYVAPAVLGDIQCLELITCHDYPDTSDSGDAVVLVSLPNNPDWKPETGVAFVQVHYTASNIIVCQNYDEGSAHPNSSCRFSYSRGRSHRDVSFTSWVSNRAIDIPYYIEFFFQRHNNNEKTSWSSSSPSLSYGLDDSLTTVTVSPTQPRSDCGSGDKTEPLRFLATFSSPIMTVYNGESTTFYAVICPALCSHYPSLYENCFIDVIVQGNSNNSAFNTFVCHTLGVSSESCPEKGSDVLGSDKTPAMTNLVSIKYVHFPTLKHIFVSVKGEGSNTDGHNMFTISILIREH